ncbi:head-tail joining protein [Sphingobium scionense]|uniref:Uncharacterized protein n=1 Tax=Sphingobium scionense TaxID=1404341 RepID=A0A7W6PXD4_9SPHN|nr:hypothetical protein [Sphingobium scionense]MBB4149127.1 hypothetical protein [Sphingobium scionense]
MADPFATGMATLRASAASVAGRYSPPSGPAVEDIRVIHSQPSEISDDGELVMDKHSFVIFRSDVDMPEHNGVISIAAGDFRINGDCLLDNEGLSWTCPTQPA